MTDRVLWLRRGHPTVRGRGEQGHRLGDHRPDNPGLPGEDRLAAAAGHRSWQIAAPVLCSGRP